MKALLSMMKYIRRNRKLWVCGIFVPAFFSTATNLYFADRLQRYVIMITERRASLWEIFGMLLITLFVLLLLSWIDGMGLYAFSLFSAFTENELRDDFYDRLVRTPMKNLQKIGRGEFLIRYNTDIEQSTQIASRDMFGVLYPLFVGTGYMIAVLKADFRIGMIMVLLGGIVILLNFIFVRRIKQVQTEILQAKEACASSCSDAIRGKMSIRQYCAQRTMSRKIEEAAEQLYQRECCRVRLETLKILTSGMAADSCMYLLTPFACIMAVFGSIGVPVVLFIHQLCRCFIMYTKSFAISFLQYSEHSLSFERVNSVLSFEDEKAENRGCRRGRAPGNYAVTFRNVCVAYGNRQVLKDVSFTVSPGECIGIVGESGSGKSTLVKALMQMIEYQGEIFLGEENCRNLSLDILRKSIAYAPEHNDIFPVAVYENIRYGNLMASEEEINHAAAMAGITEDRETFFRRDVGENGGQLSGGQRQKVSLARALLKNAPVYIFDEPTAALDAEAETILLNTVLQLKQEGKCILLITHKASTLHVADRILRVEGGCVFGEEQVL